MTTTDSTENPSPINSRKQLAELLKALERFENHIKREQARADKQTAKPNKH